MLLMACFLPLSEGKGRSSISTLRAVVIVISLCIWALSAVAGDVVQFPGSKKQEASTNHNASCGDLLWPKSVQETTLISVANRFPAKDYLAKELDIPLLNSNDPTLTEIALLMHHNFDSAESAKTKAHRTYVLRAMRDDLIELANAAGESADYIKLVKNKVHETQSVLKRILDLKLHEISEVARFQLMVIGGLRALRDSQEFKFWQQRREEREKTLLSDHKFASSQFDILMMRIKHYIDEFPEVTRKSNPDLFLQKIDELYRIYLLMVLSDSINNLSSHFVYLGTTDTGWEKMLAQEIDHITVNKLADPDSRSLGHLQNREFYLKFLSQLMPILQRLPDLMAEQDRDDLDFILSQWIGLTDIDPPVFEK